MTANFINFYEASDDNFDTELNSISSLIKDNYDASNPENFQKFLANGDDNILSILSKTSLVKLQKLNENIRLNQESNALEILYTLWGNNQESVYKKSLLHLFVEQNKVDELSSIIPSLTDVMKEKNQTILDIKDVFGNNILFDALAKGKIDLFKAIFSSLSEEDKAKSFDVKDLNDNGIFYLSIAKSQNKNDVEFFRYTFEQAKSTIGMNKVIELLNVKAIATLSSNTENIDGLLDVLISSLSDDELNQVAERTNLIKKLSKDHHNDQLEQLFLKLESPNLVKVIEKKEEDLKTNNIKISEKVSDKLLEAYNKQLENAKSFEGSSEYVGKLEEIESEMKQFLSNASDLLLNAESYNNIILDVQKSIKLRKQEDKEGELTQLLQIGKNFSELSQDYKHLASYNEILSKYNDVDISSLNPHSFRDDEKCQGNDKVVLLCKEGSDENNEKCEDQDYFSDSQGYCAIDNIDALENLNNAYSDHKKIKTSCVQYNVNGCSSYYFSPLSKFQSRDLTFATLESYKSKGKEIVEEAVKGIENNINAKLTENNLGQYAAEGFDGGLVQFCQDVEQFLTSTEDDASAFEKRSDLKSVFIDLCEKEVDNSGKIPGIDPQEGM